MKVCYLKCLHENGESYILNKNRNDKTKFSKNNKAITVVFKIRAECLKT